jgi:antitoxin CptB
MDRALRLKRLDFRSHHRGTKEADLLIGGFFDQCSAHWDDAAIGWFEALVEEEDVNIMAWAIGTQAAPERYAGPLLTRLQQLDYISLAK